jgi:nicotinamide-nucleotide amidase
MIIVLDITGGIEKAMKAEIITSGTELLLGEITDFNTPFIAGQLAMLGIDLYYTSAVGDNFDRYSAVLRQAWTRSDLVFTTGGLGPTQGDITREVIAGLLGEKMAVIPELKTELTGFFARRGIEMPENNFKQATLIPSAAALPNNCGTAPGWWVEKGGRTIVALPGPPIELQDMWRHEVLPRLEARSGAIILSRTLKTWGVSEGKVDELLSPFLGGSDPTLGIYARADGIHLRITAKEASRSAAAARVAGREAEIRRLMGDSIWGADEDTLEGVVGDILGEKGLSVGCSETVTTGLLAQTLAGNPASCGRFRGGVMLPADKGGDGGRALEMASAARQQFSADIGIAIDGGGEGGQVFIAVDGGGRQKVIETGFPGNPQQVARRAVTHALIFLRNYLRG